MRAVFVGIVRDQTNYYSRAKKKIRQEEFKKRDTVSTNLERPKDPKQMQKESIPVL